MRKTTFVGFRLSEEKKAELRALAEQMGISISAVICIAVSEYLKNNELKGQ